MMRFWEALDMIHNIQNAVVYVNGPLQAQSKYEETQLTFLFPIVTWKMDRNNMENYLYGYGVFWQAS